MPLTNWIIAIGSLLVIVGITIGALIAGSRR